MLNEIATLANKDYVKASKKDLFEIVQKIVQDQPLSDMEKAQLYKGYLPKLGKVPKTAFEWALQVRAGKDDTRYYLRYGYSNGTDFACTDGHRCHVVRKAGLEEGFYNEALHKVEVEATYPDFERVIPKRNLVPVDIPPSGFPLLQILEHTAYDMGNDSFAFMKEYYDAAIRKVHQHRVQMVDNVILITGKFSKYDVEAVVMGIRK